MLGPLVLTQGLGLHYTANAQWLRKGLEQIQCPYCQDFNLGGGVKAIPTRYPTPSPFGLAPTGPQNSRSHVGRSVPHCQSRGTNRGDHS